MNYETYQPFFLQPTDSGHRRYETLRSVFVEGQPLAEVAARFEVSYGTVRNWVSLFRQQFDAGEVPPFSPARVADAPRPTTRCVRKSRSRSRTSKPCRWSLGVG
jgi:transposase-like protein